jgi:hypothetical protein
VVGAIDRLQLPSAGSLAADLELLGPPGRVLSATRPVVVLDIETAGLSGASVGMVALAWHEGAVFRIEQWTLLRAHGERRLLSEVMQTLAQVAPADTALLTFNGASFDLPVLRGRLLRTGLDPAALDRTHIDLLPVCRRLWADHLHDCRLCTLERRMLAVHRVGDVSGAEIVEIFARQWSTPDLPSIARDLQRAEAHNAIDVITLAALAAAAAARLRAPRDLATALRAARHFVRSGRLDAAQSRLDAAVRPLLEGFARGDTARAGCDELDAMLLLAEIHRRAARYEAAARLWTWVCRNHRGHIGAHEALAKYFEHRQRSPAHALAVAEQSHAPCPRRLARLRRKLAPVSSGV